MVQAQLYQFVRLGRAGYQEVVDDMMANARYLNEALEKTGRFEVMNPGLAEPVVTFRLRDTSAFDEYHLVDRLRMEGWIVPAYSLPPNAQDVTVMRVVVRNDMTRDKADILLAHIDKACAYLDAAGVPPTEPARKTHDKQRRRC
jgi:glutamate decarboxylase